MTFLHKTEMLDSREPQFKFAQRPDIGRILAREE